MKISILVPVYNEEKTIRRVLTQLITVRLPYQKEIIVINDGSTDKTKRYIQEVRTQNKKVSIKTLHHKINKGKGAAISTGLRETTGDYILIQDADAEYNPSEIPKLLTPLSLLQKGKKTISHFAIYGSRFKNDQFTIPFFYFLGNKILTILTNFLCRTSLTDMETGYKLIPTSLMKSLHITSQHFDFEPEVTVKLIKRGIYIHEIPISYKGRTHLAGKKLTMKDTLEAIRALFYFRFFK